MLLLKYQSVDKIIRVMLRKIYFLVSLIISVITRSTYPVIDARQYEQTVSCKKSIGALIPFPHIDFRILRLKITNQKTT